jgi:hypothetical protein
VISGHLEASGYEQEWDFHIKEGSGDVLSRFKYSSHLSFLYLACRMRHLGVLTSDVYHWYQSGQLPYSNVLEKLPRPLQTSIESVRSFFDPDMHTTNVSACRIAQDANYYHFHLKLPLPSINMGLVALNITRTLRLPLRVLSNFHALLRFLPLDVSSLREGKTEERSTEERSMNDERDMESEDDVWDENQDKNKRHDGCWSIPGELELVAYLIVAVKLCPHWHLWTYRHEFDDISCVAPFQRRQPSMKRKHVTSFVALSEMHMQAKPSLKDHDGVPKAFERHKQQLWEIGTLLQQEHDEEEEGEDEEEDDCRTKVKRRMKMGTMVETYRRNEVVAFPPLYKDGVPMELDLETLEETAKVEPGLFYPYYQRSHKRGPFHGVMEELMDVFAEYLDISLAVLDQRVSRFEKKLIPRLLKPMKHGENDNSDNDDDDGRSDATQDRVLV